jgi:UDP-N-acetylenolpyruvoylglucosamine reductase
METFYKGREHFSLKHFEKRYSIKNLEKKDLRKEIVKIRRKVYPDIKKFRNVGSTFKDTEITKKELKNILKKYPNIPN